MRCKTLLFAAALALLLLTASTAPVQAAGGKVRVAFALLGGIDDQGWNTAQYEGIQALKKQLGGRVSIAYTQNVADPARAEAVFRDYARKGYDIIFGTTFGHMEPLLKVAAEFPHVRFMQCAGYKTLPNLGVYMVRIEQGDYLAGYTAGLMGYKNVGTVATQPILEVVRGINAFTLGLARGLSESGTAYDPARINTVVWLNSWRDAAREKQLAEELAAGGHDLIREMADTSDSSKAACAVGVASIGYGTDSTRYGAACALTSTTFKWGPVYTRTVRQVLDGTWKSGAIFTGFEGGGVALAPFGKAVPKAVRAKVLALKAKMTKGEDMSFAGPVLDQAGTLRVRKGAKASDKELLSMDWLVMGVGGALPR
ncbi:MAG: BMP family ABC transporter substrate-binding protein [Desulfovibrionaceae bacterium CG1_02_65_16]|nr:MAG: BMP family ABC transporter substrate-binding protein [Desulfovibrionaceae bacterium CG1_02_65_16]